MKKLLTTLTTTALSTVLCAQTTFTSPAGYDTESANTYGYNYCLVYAGSNYKSARFQLTDAFMPSGVSILTQLDYRTTTALSYATSGASSQGRKFSALTLQLGNAKSTLTTTFTSNWNGTPTTVFSSSWSLPTIIGPTSKAVWGNAGSLPFSTIAVFDASKGDLLQDWSHSGGSMANGAPNALVYYVDSHTYASSIYVNPFTNNAAPSRYVPRYYYNQAGGQCNDSSITYTTYDAYAYINLYVYADNHPTTTLQGQGRISNSTTAYTAPAANVIAMLSLGGSDVGTNAGALCNKLHVNTLFPLAIITKVAATSASASTSGWFPTTPFGKWNDAWAGQVVFWQAAWQNTADKGFALTSATRLVLPKKPVYDTAKIHRFVYQNTTATATTGPIVGTNNSLYNMVERFTRK